MHIVFAVNISRSGGMIDLFDTSTRKVSRVIVSAEGCNQLVEAAQGKVDGWVLA